MTKSHLQRKFLFFYICSEENNLNAEFLNKSLRIDPKNKKQRNWGSKMWIDFDESRDKRKNQKN